jgi:formylglycine-generating enzyme required for sulfatase activity
MGTTDAELAALYALCDPILGAASCRTQGFEEEIPAHDVTLDPYYIDLHEVTNAEFAAFLTEMGNQSGGGVQWYEATDADARLQFAADQWQPVPAYADHPATEVTWYGAHAYCEWLGGRLPTEAEWEKAARWDPATGEVRVYPWGPTQPTAAEANYAMTGTGTRPVGSFEAGRSPLGLYDAAGNVFEWVADWFQPGGYSADPVSNPQGPADGMLKVIRGGSWGDNAFFLRAANRGTLIPTGALNFVGFRCAMDAGE